MTGAGRVRRERLRLALAAPEPYGGFESRWTDVAGLPVHSRRSTAAATGPPVVLVHGVAVSHRYLMPLAARPAVEHPVALVDLPGFGLSADTGRVLDIPDLADALSGWLDAEGLAAPVLAGNSVGCQVLVDLLARQPERARAAVLVGPTMDPHARSASRQVLRWLRNLRHEDLLQAPVIARDVLDAGVRRAAVTFRWSLQDRVEDKLPAVAVPTLVTRGALEPVVSQRWAQEAAALLPRGELAVVPDGPHNSNYSAPEQLAALVLPFLSRVLA